MVKNYTADTSKNSIEIEHDNMIDDKSDVTGYLKHADKVDRDRPTGNDITKIHLLL